MPSCKLAAWHPSENPLSPFMVKEQNDTPNVTLQSYDFNLKPVLQETRQPFHLDVLPNVKKEK